MKFVRPSGDWLFTGAATSFREGAFAIVMSGLQNDVLSAVARFVKRGAPDQIPFVMGQLLARLDVDRCVLRAASD